MSDREPPRPTGIRTATRLLSGALLLSGAIGLWLLRSAGQSYEVLLAAVVAILLSTLLAWLALQRRIRRWRVALASTMHDHPETVQRLHDAHAQLRVVVSAGRIRARFRIAAQVAGIIVASVGSLALAGWCLDIEVLKSGLPGQVTVKANTALAFLLAGISLWLQRADPAVTRPEASRRVAQACAAVVALIGALTLAEYALGADLGIDQLLFAEPAGAPGTSSPGRMAPTTALSFLVAGLALFLVDTATRNGGWPAQWLVVTGSFSSLLALIGYLYGSTALYGFAGYTQMAVYTALSFICLFAGVLFVRPAHGVMATVTAKEPSGRLSRGLLPSVVALPILVGWLLLQGQEAGFYDSHFGLSLMVTTIVVMFTTQVWWTALALNLSSRERAVAREALQKSEQRFRALIEQASDLVSVLDAEGVVRYASPSHEHVLGYAGTELIGRRSTDYEHPDDSARLREQFTRLLGRPGGTQRIEFRYRHKDGTWRVFDGISTNLIDDPAVRGVVVNSRDITDRKQAEQALRESQIRLSGIVDSAMDGIVTVDEAERILVFNAAAEKMFGCPAAEAIGGPVERFIPERSRAAHHGHLRRFGQTGDTQRATAKSVPISGRRANGEEFPIEASISRTQVDHHLLFTVILRDVTEQVRSEEARAQLEAQLRLAQKMEALGTLAGGIAHDFNNILGAIIGNAELASQDVGANLPAMESLDEIRKASHRAKDLVQRILAFGRQHQEPQSVIPLRPVVEEALTFLRATLPAGVEIAATFDADAPTVLADSTQIHQVLINLCTNAWHAMEGHAGRIAIRLDGVTLDAEAARADATLWPGRFARLSVTDTGTGMDAATLERIFEPFFTTKPVGEGTGLGLSVVHGIVKVHGGAITATSQPGRGTTFTLYFPAVHAPEQSAPPEDAASKPLPAAGGQHVLYLDDEESLVFLVTRTLERLGYRVSGYTRAEEALAAVRADPAQFDLVVTDLNMPGMSGLDVARELARLRPDLPVVLASGYITEELRAAAPETGVRQLIYKPNTVEELCKIVQRLAGEPKTP